MAGAGKCAAPGRGQGDLPHAVGQTHHDIAAATNTSLAGVGQYKLVNRNSGLALESVNGTWQLAGQAFGDAGQAVAITKVS
ncbi:hypothetical protein ABH935_005275 [Catenulispora sp. GAS73]|uniref:hypothetical protein n=1 Tax=Catenulispora sp. GAS73 TaxID=3156269 RepID=UPI0035134137